MSPNNGKAEIAAGVGGGVYGYANPRDMDGDGDIDDRDRQQTAAAYGMGGLITVGTSRGLLSKAPINAGRHPVQSTFGGVKAKTADLKLQRIAQDMEKAGASRDQIWKETGWFKGNDGKWRFEIDDSGSKMLPPIDYRNTKGWKAKKGTGRDKGRWIVYDQHGRGVGNTSIENDPTPQDAIDVVSRNFRIFGTGNQLGNQLGHPELYKAYPDLAKIQTRIGRSPTEEGFHESYANSPWLEGITASAPDDAGVRSVLLHEAGGHGVQAREGFATGGSPDVSMIDDVEAIGNAYNNTGRPWNELDGNMQDNILRNAAMDRYRRLAGEVEARNVQTRRDFTPEERRARPPWTTQDVPDEQQIVRYGSGQANSIFGGGRKPPSAHDVPAKLGDQKPTANELRISQTINSLRARNIGDAAVSEHLATFGINIAPDRIEHFARMTKAQPSHAMSPDRVDDFVAKGRELRELRALQFSDDEIAKRLGIGSAPKALREQLFDSYERAYRSEESFTEIPATSQKAIAAEAKRLPPPTQASFGGSPGKPGGKGPPAVGPKGPPRKPRPVESRREAPRGSKPFSDPRLSPGENKTAEMVFNGYSYDEIADEMMTSVDVVKRQAMLAQRKLGDDVKLPRPGMGRRPPGTTKREAINEMFAGGLDNVTIAERAGVPIGTVRTYRSYWKQGSGAPVANVNGASYNPPAMPERPFEADYPQKDWPDGVPTDAQGRLVLDMEGRPLDQNSVVVGRTKAPGVGPKSEADQTLRDRIAVIQTLKQAGSSLERVPRSADQTSGSWSPNFDANGRFTGRGSARITDDLDRPIAGLDDQEVITLSHELAHSIDFRAKPARNVGGFNKREWGIDHRNPDKMPPASASKIESQLQRVYRDLNNPIDGEVKIRTPRDHGYDAVDADRELWAEAIRAYMWDPNYIKTVAPDVAFMIRHHVNRNSSLRKTIQFNSAPIVGIGGLGLAGAVAASGQNDQR